MLTLGLRQDNVELKSGACRTAYLVVDVTVGKHGVKVLHGLTGAPVIVVLQAFLDGPHVHGVLDDLMVVLQTEV